MNNYLVGSKISITSKKAQTTRYQLLGIQTIDDTQFLFIDTPGFQLKHLNLMNKGLNKTVHQVLNDVDIVLFVIESRGMTEEDHVSGSIKLDQKEILGITVQDSLREGIAYIPESRELDGLISSFSIVENLILK